MDTNETNACKLNQNQLLIIDSIGSGVRFPSPEVIFFFDGTLILQKLRKYDVLVKATNFLKNFLSTSIFIHIRSDVVSLTTFTISSQDYHFYKI